MEIEQHLQVLLGDDSGSGLQDSQNYFDIVASKTQDSLLSFHGIKILPPLLSEADKQTMREYRRKAVNLEQKHFETRRERYSNLLLQVMQLMDQFQAEKVSKKNKNAESEQPYTQISQSTRMDELALQKTLTQSDTRSNNAISNSDKKSNKLSKNHSENNFATKDETRITGKQILMVDDDSLVPIFQKPKLYNSSSSPTNNKMRSISGPIQKETPSETSVRESVGRETVMSSSSTLKGSDQSIGETLESGRNLNPSDSLASTVLSMAFTESSFVSQQSSAEGPQQSLKSAQRQLDMDHVNHNSYQSYYQQVNPLTSTPDLQKAKPISIKKVTTKKTSSLTSQKSGVSSKGNTKTITEQDKALEKLEIMKKKLLEEKEKQMAYLRQQELARLRKSKNQPLVSKEHEEVTRNVYPVGHIPSRPSSDMYSIPERSFEGTSSFIQAEQTEIESASDKENNAWQQNAYQVNNNNEMSYGNQVIDDRHESERFSREIDSRPISVQSREGFRQSREHRRSSLYVRQEFQKQFEIEMSKENNGKDKFSILTAYAKGFMTRRVLRTEKVQAIIKTIKDTSKFLADISREGTTSYQDKTLQQRVQAQLIAAKSQLYDIFFTISISERMTYVEHSRNAAREREGRMNAKANTHHLTRKLSVATMKAMQRRQEETNNNSDVRKTSAVSQLGKRRSVDTRALKPVLSTKSPQVPEKSRSQVKRRSLASPLARRSIGKKNYTNRPATAIGTKTSSRKAITRSSKEETNDRPTRPSRTSLDKTQITKRTKPNTTRTNTESNSSKLPVKKRESLGGGLTYRVSEEDSEKTVPKTRPSTAIPGFHQYVPGQVVVNYTRPKTTPSTRRVTRSMAANFKK